MSDQEFSREQDHTLGSEVPTVFQPATLTPSFVSNAIKEAFGSFKEYFDSSIAQVKEESEKKLSAASTELQQLKRASELSFRFKGNRVQFEFNSSLQEKLEKGVALLEEGKHVAALSKLKEGIADIRKRKKLFRLADKSDAGWSAVDEYLSDDLASDSEDEKRIRQAQARAARKRKSSRNIPAAKGKPPKSDGYRTASPSSGHFFRGFSGKSRYAYGGTGNSSLGWRGASSGPKSTDFCFACGKQGHWRRGCPGAGNQGPPIRDNIAQQR
ncbi:uncharacterized protein [Diadema setosum]|uniref:uncharacterized protein n=1 Tax=Diadema setosum TaxID=31175 RepID=UPI003B3BDB36